MGLEVKPPTKRAMIKTGTYTGNNADNRDIDIGIDLSSKDNVWVSIKGASASEGVFRTEYGQGDLTMFFSAVADMANLIQNYNATGFQIGSDPIVNQNGILFRWIAVWEEG